jgi:hypothetical protein
MITGMDPLVDLDAAAGELARCRGDWVCGRLIVDEFIWRGRSRLSPIGELLPIPRRWASSSAGMVATRPN